jgi:hypothetical protein
MSFNAEIAALPRLDAAIMLYHAALANKIRPKLASKKIKFSGLHRQKKERHL